MITQDGKVYIQKIKGYCCKCHSPYQKIADEEKLPLDHLYFALTVYGETRGENDTSKKAIAWVMIKNRFEKRWEESLTKKLYLEKVNSLVGKKVIPIMQN